MLHTLNIYKFYLKKEKLQVDNHKHEPGDRGENIDCLKQYQVYPELHAM